jgi:hypothetical protein
MILASPPPEQRVKEPKCPYCRGAGYLKVLWSDTYQPGDKIACGNCALPAKAPSHAS